MILVSIRFKLDSVIIARWLIEAHTDLFYAALDVLAILLLFTPILQDYFAYTDAMLWSYQ